MPTTVEVATAEVAILVVAGAAVPEEVLAEVPVEATTALISRWVAEGAVEEWLVSEEAEPEVEVEVEMNVSNFRF